jgi:hypothetical protein
MPLQPVLSISASEYVIRKVQEFQTRLYLNGTYQRLAYAEGVNFLLSIHANKIEILI